MFNRAAMASSISDELFMPILDGTSMPALHHANPLPNQNVRNFSLATEAREPGVGILKQTVRPEGGAGESP